MSEYGPSQSVLALAPELEQELAFFRDLALEARGYRVLTETEEAAKELTQKLINWCQYLPTGAILIAPKNPENESDSDTYVLQKNPDTDQPVLYLLTKNGRKPLARKISEHLVAKESETRDKDMPETDIVAIDLSRIGLAADLDAAVWQSQNPNHQPGRQFAELLNNSISLYQQELLDTDICWCLDDAGHEMLHGFEPVESPLLAPVKQTRITEMLTRVQPNEMVWFDQESGLVLVGSNDQTQVFEAVDAEGNWYYQSETANLLVDPQGEWVEIADLEAMHAENRLTELPLPSRLDREDVHQFLRQIESHTAVWEINQMQPAVENLLDRIRQLPEDITFTLDNLQAKRNGVALGLTFNNQKLVTWRDSSQEVTWYTQNYTSQPIDAWQALHNLLATDKAIRVEGIDPQLHIDFDRAINDTVDYVRWIRTQPEFATQTEGLQAFAAESNQPFRAVFNPAGQLEVVVESATKPVVLEEDSEHQVNFRQAALVAMKEFDLAWDQIQALHELVGGRDELGFRLEPVVFTDKNSAYYGLPAWELRTRTVPFVDHNEHQFYSIVAVNPEGQTWVYLPFDSDQPIDSQVLPDQLDDLLDQVLADPAADDNQGELTWMASKDFERQWHRIQSQDRNRRIDNLIGSLVLDNPRDLQKRLAAIHAARKRLQSAESAPIRPDAKPGTILKFHPDYEHNQLEVEIKFKPESNLVLEIGAEDIQVWRVEADGTRTESESVFEKTFVIGVVNGLSGKALTENALVAHWRHRQPIVLHRIMLTDLTKHNEFKKLSRNLKGLGQLWVVNGQQEWQLFQHDQDGRRVWEVINNGFTRQIPVEALDLDTETLAILPETNPAKVAALVHKLERIGRKTPTQEYTQSELL